MRKVLPNYVFRKGVFRSSIKKPAVHDSESAWSRVRQGPSPRERGGLPRPSPFFSRCRRPAGDVYSVSVQSKLRVTAFFH